MSYNEILNQYKLTTKSDIWAITSRKPYEIPSNGYKIHISAYTYNIIPVAKEIIPYLVKNKIYFKVVNSVDNLKQLNKGKYGFSQIGKAVTIYPQNFKHFQKIIQEIHLITRKFSSPTIPSDYRYFNSDCVFYRYGELQIDESSQNGQQQDLRVSLKQNQLNELPFSIDRNGNYLQSIMIIRSIASRGKSVVFQAVNRKTKELILVKKGIKKGEYSGNNIDGSFLALNEVMMTKKLVESPAVPVIQKTWLDNEDCFFIREYCKGETLEQLLKENMLSKDDVKLIFDRGWELVTMAHSKGIVINDISLNNFIYDTEKQILKFIDFEFSYERNDRLIQQMTNHIYTPGFGKVGLEGYLKDCYAFLKLIYFLNNRNEYMTLRKDDIYRMSDTVEKKIMELTFECKRKRQEEALFNKIISL